MSCLCEADGSCLMTHDPYDVEHGSAFLWSGSLFWTLWINKIEPSTHWKREKDIGKGVCVSTSRAVQCFATHPFPTTSRETKPTRPFPCLVRVAGEDEYFKIKVRLLQVLLYPLFHTCNFYFLFFLLLFFYLINLEVSFSPAAVAQSDNTSTHHFPTVQLLLSSLQQNIPMSCTFSHMACQIRRNGMLSVRVDPVSTLLRVTG